RRARCEERNGDEENDASGPRDAANHMSPRTVRFHFDDGLHAPEIHRTSTVTVRLSSLPFEKPPVSPQVLLAVSNEPLLVELAATLQHSSPLVAPRHTTNN